jgi:hypothetical protein
MESPSVSSRKRRVSSFLSLLVWVREWAINHLFRRLLFTQEKQKMTEKNFASVNWLSYVFIHQRWRRSKKRSLSIRNSEKAIMTVLSLRFTFSLLIVFWLDTSNRVTPLRLMSWRI